MPNKLKQRRQEIGLTQQDIADRVGVSGATVARWESGDIANMRRDRIDAYAAALRVPLQWMLSSDGELSVESFFAELKDLERRYFDVAVKLSVDAKLDPVMRSILILMRELPGAGEKVATDVVKYLRFLTSKSYDGGKV